MERHNFADVLKSAKVDIKLEYDRLHALFYDGDQSSVAATCDKYFIKYWFRGTCLSLQDFDQEYGFDFYMKDLSSVDIDCLISFCEYIHNLVRYNPNIQEKVRMIFIQQLYAVLEKIGYTFSTSKEKMIFIAVPKIPEAFAVAEIIEPSLSYKVIEYNHHSLKGNIEKKKEILLKLAELLEPNSGKLKQINSTLKTNLFYLFNTMNIRHNNIDPSSSNYKAYVANMARGDLEKWYDEIYQLCLLAFLELDNVERNDIISELKSEIENK